MVEVTVKFTEDQIKALQASADYLTANIRKTEPEAKAWTVADVVCIYAINGAFADRCKGMVIPCE